MKQSLTAFLVILSFVASSVVAFASGKINGGYDVPYLGDNIESAEFIAELIEDDYGGDEEVWLEYAWSLARTLSQLTPEEQQVIWYGP